MSDTKLYRRDGVLKPVMVRSAFLNSWRAPWTACFIALTILVHPAQSQESKPTAASVEGGNRAVQSQLPFGDRFGVRTVAGVSAQVLHAMPIGQVFDYLGTRVDGPRAGKANIVINWRFSDTHESLASTLEYGALTSMPGETATNAMTTVTTTRTVFESVVLRQQTLADAMEHREITTRGDAKAVSDLWTMLAYFETGLPVDEPADEAHRSIFCAI